MADKRVTIKDVARAAGVSISTVSNALNGVDVLHPDTKQRVLETARKLHYVPDLNGRNLKSQENKVIGLFLSSIKEPAYGLLAEEIYKACQEKGYEFQIFVSNNAQSMLTNILGNRVSGALICNSFIGKQEEAVLLEYEAPVFFLDRTVSGRYALCSGKDGPVEDWRQEELEKYGREAVRAIDTMITKKRGGSII